MPVRPMPAVDGSHNAGAVHVARSGRIVNYPGPEDMDDLLEEQAERVAGILEDRWEHARRTGGHVQPCRPPVAS